MNLCIPITPDGQTAQGWGRARRVAVATATDSQIVDWRETDVGWDTLHDQGTEGSHHARVARFLIDHQIEVVVAEHMGPGMVRMLTSMGIRIALGAPADARSAVLAALASAD
jgi:predicted Fe-Mo cluster-binding NifX family protein